MLFLIAFFFIYCEAGQFRAGKGKVDIGSDLVGLGCPLAGYNHGERRVPYWPIPSPRRCTTFMTPNVGIEPGNGIYTRALAIDDGETIFMFVTIDGIGADSALNDMSYDIATIQGLKVPKANIIVSASHSHSGPGAITPEFLWQVAPATDILSPEAQRITATNIAKAMVDAYKNLVPAQINVGTEQLINVTRNRRCNKSPMVGCKTIDPNLGLIRVDDKDGKSIATVWNYAMHGTCLGPNNMKYSGDIMGLVNQIIEKQTGGIAVYINADSGDINPDNWVCDGAPNFNGAPVIAEAVLKGRKNIVTSKVGTLTAASENVFFGPTNLNFTLERWANCSEGGPLNICTICKMIGCTGDVALHSNWIENNPKFTALKLDINGNSSIVGTIPGEALLELGWWIRNDTLKLGYDHTILAGYTNSHMGYFATPVEYLAGGYESQLTMWGISTADTVRKGFMKVVQEVTKSGLPPKRNVLRHKIRPERLV